MTELTPPLSEAAERLGEAALTNLAEAVDRLRVCTVALAASADTTASGSVPAADLLARSTLSMWVGGFRSIAVTAAAVTDAAAILTYPPELVERYTIDLAELLPGRTEPVTLSIMSVAWERAQVTRIEPTVMIVGGSTVAAPSAGVVDVATVSVRPSMQPMTLTVSLQLTTSAATTGPVTVDVRLAPDKLVLDP